MSNIRYYSLEGVRVTVGGKELESFPRAGSVDTYDPHHGEFARTMGNQWMAAPLDATLSKALRDVYRSDMTGAEKVKAVQALTRVTDQNVCAECDGQGWVVEIINQSMHWPHGEQTQAECPSCNGRGSRFSLGE